MYARVQSIVFDPTTQAFVYTPVAYQQDVESKWLQGGQSGSINGFSGTIQFTVNFNADQYFYIDALGDQWLEAISTQQASSVPEPTSLTLLCSGLTGIALAAWHKRK